MNHRSLLPLAGGLALLGSIALGNLGRPTHAAPTTADAPTPVTLLPTGTAVPPNHTPATARLVAPGTILAGLNFTPAGNAADFYRLRAKPGNAYAVYSEVRPGLDTYILVWEQPVPSNPPQAPVPCAHWPAPPLPRSTPTVRDGWTLIAQNDDANPHTPDLSSRVDWCAQVDSWVLAEVRNYGGDSTLDPAGRGYNLAVLINPPPTPTMTPTAAPAAPTTNGGTGSNPVNGGAGSNPVNGGAGSNPVNGGAGSNPVNGGAGSNPSGYPPPAQPTRIPPPTVAPPATRTPLPTATGVPSLTPLPSATPSPTGTPTASATATATATATPIAVSVDVVAYIGRVEAPGPLLGDGLVGWPVQLVDQRSNRILQTALTDADGHAQLRWTWAGPVWVQFPTLRYSVLIAGPTDPILTGGPLYARKPTYTLPGIWP